MARVSIYVSDDLKARMAEAGDALNWSGIARPAFESAIAEFNHRRGRSMTTAIERLRASKKNYMEHATTHGSRDGRKWAEDQAHFIELRAVSRIDLGEFEDNPEYMAPAIKAAVDPENLNRFDDMPDILFGDERWPPGEWLVGWVRGAQELFEEVEDQL